MLNTTIYQQWTVAVDKRGDRIKTQLLKQWSEMSKISWHGGYVQESWGQNRKPKVAVPQPTKLFLFLASMTEPWTYHVAGSEIGFVIPIQNLAREKLENMILGSSNGISEEFKLSVLDPDGNLLYVLRYELANKNRNIHYNTVTITLLEEEHWIEVPFQDYNGMR